MALTSADGTSIIADGKALLVILRYKLLKRCVSKRNTGTIGDDYEVINLCPAVPVQGEAIFLGLMPQDQAYELTEADELRVHMMPRD